MTITADRGRVRVNRPGVRGDDEGVTHDRVRMIVKGEG